MRAQLPNPNCNTVINIDIPDAQRARVLALAAKLDAPGYRSGSPTFHGLCAELTSHGAPMHLVEIPVREWFLERLREEMWVGAPVAVAAE